MRRGLALGALLGVVNTGVVVLLEWATRKGGEFGWFGYAPLNRHYADYLPAPRHIVTGWAAVALFGGVLLVVNMLLVAGYGVARRRRERAVA